jgi:Na+/H+-dicarboxylate symporter
MTSLEIKIPSSKTLLHCVGRSFIGLIVVILIDFIWEAVRDKCDTLTSQGIISWMQLLISWIIMAVILAMMKPKNIHQAIILSIILGLLVGAIGSPCHEERKIGDYILDLIQGITTTLITGVVIYSVSKKLKWYP